MVRRASRAPYASAGSLDGTDGFAKTEFDIQAATWSLDLSFYGDDACACSRVIPAASRPTTVSHDAKRDRTMRAS